VTLVTDKRARRAASDARRAAASGSGPVREDVPPARFPGAKNWFGLLGEVLAVGMLVSLASLPLITLPAALAAGVGHMRRYLLAEETTFDSAWRQFKAAFLGGAVVAVASIVLVLVLLLDIDLANSGALPGGPVIAAVGWIGLAAVGLALFTAAGLWTADRGWRRSIALLPGIVRGDPAGAAYTVATGVFAVIVTWQLAPLIVPALGCVVLAIVAIPERSRRGHGDTAQ
jgi:hypothetical protein